jgi:conserved oligomeric Golgi complex subunit 4
LLTYCQGLQLDRTGKETLVVPDFVATSNLQKKVTNILLDSFNSMTTFFFRRSVEKAFQLDEPPSELTLNPNKPLNANPPFMTSAVDEVMYIVNHSLQRSIATAQRAVVTSVVPTIGRVLSGDFVGMIQRKMRDESYPKAAIAGALPPEDKTIQFLVLLNNLDIANGYFKRIVASHLRTDHTSSTDQESGGTVAGGPTPLKDLFPFANDAQIVEAQLRSMEHGFRAKTTELINDGVQVLFHQIIKPRLRPLLADTFRDIDYSPDAKHHSANDAGHDGSSASHTAADHDDPDGPAHDDTLVRRRFDKVWNALLRPLKRILTDANFARLLEVAVSSLAKNLEKRVWSYHGRVGELGAVRLERDVAGIVAGAVGGGRYELRDQFARCVQVCLVMNMEEDEWEEVLRGEGEGEEASGVVWVLDEGERRRARAIVGG